MRRMLPDRHATLSDLTHEDHGGVDKEQAASTAQRSGRCSSVAIGFGTPTAAGASTSYQR